MDIALLKTFLEIYQLRHFGRAAEKLYITQSAASARIKLLEEKLGVPLFTRAKHVVKPTAAGHRFHKYAEITVAGWEQAKQTVALPEEYIQSLNIGCMADIWHLFLNDWVEDIRCSLSDVALNLTIHPGYSIPDMLIMGSLDLGFVFEPVNMPVLHLQKITSLKLKLFSTDRHATLLTALDDNYIKVDWGASFAYDYSRYFSTYPASSLQTDYGVMALDLLKKQGGAAYLPEQVLERSDDINLYSVDSAPEFERSLYAVYRKDSLVEEFIEKLLSSVMKSCDK